jgi:hypothetical protein
MRRFRKTTKFDSNFHGTATAIPQSPDLPMSRILISRSHRSVLRQFALLFSLAVVFAPSIVRSQDAVRPSMAGELSSEARRQDIERIPYNLLLGPIRFRVGASVGVEYNDNINLADDGFEQDDVIIRPMLSLNAIWPVTQLNTLRLDVALSYSFYLDHSEADTNGLLIAPGSQLSFDIFVGDFRINIHDRFSISQDPISELALSNVIDYGRFENYAGVSLLWDLRAVLVTLGYDHYTYISTSDRFSYLDHNSDIFYGSAGVNLTSTVFTGVEGNTVITYYDENHLSDSTSYSVGGFIETQLTNNLRVRLAGGYQWIDFDQNFVNFFGINVPDKGDLEDYYANGLLTHQINAVVYQTLSVGHENELGINSNYITLNYIRHMITWKILRNTLLTTEFFYEDANESGGISDIHFGAHGVVHGAGKGEHIQRYGGALTVGYQLTPHVTFGLRYQYTEKDSDVRFRDYKQNRVSLDGTYSF